MLLRKTPASAFKWEEVLASDYCEPQYHISLARAIGRRLRRNYGYVLTIQALVYVGKIAIHPTAVASFGEFVERASIGPIPGAVILLAGLFFNGGWIAFALVTYQCSCHLPVRSREAWRSARFDGVMSGDADLIPRSQRESGTGPDRQCDTITILSAMRG